MESTARYFLIESYVLNLKEPWRCWTLSHLQLQTTAEQAEHQQKKNTRTTLESLFIKNNEKETKTDLAIKVNHGKELPQEKSLDLVVQRLNGL